MRITNENEIAATPLKNIVIYVVIYYVRKLWCFIWIFSLVEKP